jgi:DNA-binding PadR family transcriptional regulator
MPLRDSLLIVLTLGAAYGYQLHAEILDRTRRRAALNPGQVYSTLDRLGRDGLLEQAGTTHDGLPLYELTDAGRVEAERAVTAPRGRDFPGMVEHLLLTASLPGNRAAALVTAYRAVWSEKPATGAIDVHERAARAADEQLSAAALRWLNTLPQLEPWPLRTDRPRRGRKG